MSPSSSLVTPSSKTSFLKIFLPRKPQSLLHFVHQFLTVKEVTDVLEGSYSNVMSGLACEECLMRGDDDVGHHQQQSQLVVVNHPVGAVFVEIVGLFLVNVKSSGAYLMRAQTVDEVFGLYELAASRIDNHHAILHLRNTVAVDDELGFLRQRPVQRDDIRAFIQFVERHHLHLMLLGESLIWIDIVSQDVHAEATQNLD